MFPHENKRAWWMAGRAKHLLVGFQELENRLPAELKQTAENRCKSLATTLKIKSVLLALFYFSFVMTGFSWLAQYWDKLFAIKPAMDAIAEIASTFSMLVLIGLLVVSRHASILEMDLLLLSAHAKAE